MDLLFAAAVLAAFTLFAPAAIEGVGEFVLATGTLSAEQESIVKDLYRAVFIQVPLVAFFGSLAFGVAFYIRRNVTLQARR